MRFRDNDVFHSSSRPTLRSNVRSYDNDVFHSNTTNTFRRTESNQSTLPAAFGDMTNVHQICLWLCENSNILLLAYNMYLSMQTPTANAFSLNFSSSTLATSVPQMPRQDDKVSVTIICFSLVNVTNGQIICMIII